MEQRELMEKLFGEAAPYPGMEVEWECFAGNGAMESGIYRGKITSINWCQHCHFPTVQSESEHGARFSIRISETEQRWVCGSEAPK